MANATYDVIGIGNAIVDVLASTDESFLIEHRLDKGIMTLIDTDRAHGLYEAMGPSLEVSGGSAANTIAGSASFGGNTAFIGKVRNDPLGKIFSDDIKAIGVDYRTLPATEGATTARCLIFVTPDAERTMQTYLGISIELRPGDIDPHAIADSQITYLEGYLFDPPEARKAFVKAAEIAHAAGRQVAFTLSDPFCVDRHRSDFLDLISQHIDEEEIKSLFQVDDFDLVPQLLRGYCGIAALTRGEKGSIIVSRDDVKSVDAAPVDCVADTTGAGDLFAAGFLYGYTNGQSLLNSGLIGSLAAAEVISHYGARPQISLKKLLGESGN